MKAAKWMALLLAAALCLPPAAVSAESAQGEAQTTVQADSYAAYLSAHEGEAGKEAAILLAPETAQTAEGKAAERIDGEIGVTVSAGQTVRWRFTAESAGWYTLSVRYRMAGEGTGAAESDLLLDGAVPYKEARGLLWKREYHYASEKRYAENGDQLRPQKQEQIAWRDRTVYAAAGYIEKPLSIYLTAGAHELALAVKRESVVFGGVTLRCGQQVRDYAALSAEYREKGYTAGGRNITIQAEEPLSVSDVSLYPTTDRSSAYTEPQADRTMLFNVIGGSAWASAGQYIRYAVQVETSGLYTVSFRFKQDTLQGLCVYRRLTVDGEVPFAEAERLKFDYDSGWQVKTAGDAKNGEWQLYFEAGRTYELTLEVTCGEYAEVLSLLNAVQSELNRLYRELLMVTGPDPDLYRDYHFRELLPDTLAGLEACGEQLSQIRAELSRLSGSEGLQTAAMDNLIVQLAGMVKNPERRIAAELTTFQSNVSSLGTWIMNATSQPLMLDLLQIGGRDAAPLRADTGFFGTIGYECRRFIYSFFDDYRQENEGADRTAIEVWMTGGRDQAQILRELIGDSLTAEAPQLNVRLKLVAAGTLMPAILAGKGPDVSLSAASTEPINMAIRGAVADLTDFSDYDEVISRFHESALTPFSFRGALYALPETQSFPMLFYRTDILEELGIAVPTTWDELFDAMLELQTNNLNVGMPAAFAGLNLLMMQNGCPLYSADGKQSLLGTDGALSCFKQLTDLYVLYGFPVQYDFANRFRSGEMPLAIQEYTAYNQLVLFAPEIKGLWKMAPVPGTKGADGTVDHSAPGTVTGAMLLRQSAHPEAGWTFLKWWTSQSVQSEFGVRMESVLGDSAKYATANCAAMSGYSWSEEEQSALQAQWGHTVGIPEVPGGYYSSRYVEFAFNKVVNQSADPVAVLEGYVPTITAELQRRSQEFGY